MHLGGGLALESRDEPGVRPQAAPPQGDRRRARPTTWSGSCAAWLNERDEGEPFADWAARADEEALR